MFQTLFYFTEPERSLRGKKKNLTVWSPFRRQRSALDRSPIEEEQEEERSLRPSSAVVGLYRASHVS